MKLVVHWTTWAALSLVVTLSGCSKPYLHPQADPQNSTFPGILDVLAVTNHVHVLLIHGMCTHDPSWVTATNASLKSALNLSQTKPAEIIQLGSEGAQLYITELSSGPRVVKTFAILWSPIDAPAKKTLCYDASESTPLCEAPFSRIRASVNSKLKSQILDDCLSDAMYYIGEDGGQKIREAVKEAVVMALSGGRPSRTHELSTLSEETAPLFVISESLGSKILFDSIIELANQSESARNAMAVALSRMVEIYMAANQLPIMSLAYKARLASPGGARVEERVLASPISELAQIAVLRKFGRQTAQAAGRTTLPEESLRVIAFSDPNDLLSYTLSQTNVGVTGIDITDVLVSNDFTWFGLFENPLTAHEGYGDNDVFKRVIRCGSKGVREPC